MKISCFLEYNVVKAWTNPLNNFLIVFQLNKRSLVVIEQFTVVKFGKVESILC